MPPAQPTSFLKTVSEARYTPDDSLTITYQYDQAGRLQQEEQRISGRSIRIADLYDIRELAQVYADQYRLHSYNAQQQEIAVKHYFRTGNTWLIYDADSLRYTGNQLVRQLHYDHFFIVDGGQYSTTFPLWLTTQTKTYDDQGHILSEIDSVFITHDIPAGSSVLTKTPAHYLHSNKTTYSYNERGVLTQLVAVSGEAVKPMFYSNGWPVLSTNGSGYAASIRQRFMPGTTTYTYAYKSTGQLSAKTAAYADGKTAQTYVSRFTYAYNTQAP
ncbi:hypothetical protein [Fibrella arboris]|uniref:hypothetical protein n=1 Tax=Fibrella arboris TaxID=3242486 RepID=UPI00352295D6